MKLSVALATYNEEENIERCLKSVYKWCDEIVIVDGKSTDKTVEMANSFNAKIILKENEKNFHKNKQIAIENCTGEWILQLDADEEVTDKLRDEILEAISHPKIPFNGYWIPRKNYFLGRFLKKGGQYPDYTLRLYRQGKGRLPGNHVHEQAVVTGETGYLKNPLLHYNYPDLRDYFIHFERYTDLFAKEIIDKKQSSDFIGYFISKPLLWFISSYFRHKGFLDSWQGFLFSFFSSLRFPVSYIKSLKIKNKK